MNEREIIRLVKELLATFKNEFVPDEGILFAKVLPSVIRVTTSENRDICNSSEKLTASLHSLFNTLSSEGLGSIQQVRCLICNEEETNLVLRNKQIYIFNLDLL